MGKPIILAENVLESATTLTATNTATDFDVRNIIDRRPYTFWKATGAGTLYITANLGTAKAADTLGLLGHNFKTASAKITLQYSTNGSSWTDAVAEFEPATDKALLKTFTSASKQYWRLKIITASITPYLAIFFLGNKLAFPRYVMGDFDPAPEQIHSTSAKSKTGYPLGSIIRYISYTINISFQNLTDTFIRQSFSPVWNEYLSQLKPFFWAWDIDNHSSDVFYVVIPDNYALNMPYNPVRRNLTLQFEGIKE